jgi:hypothetical protein
MSYVIYDEESQPMRIVGRKEEAQTICAVREGWTFKCVRKPVRKVDLSELGEAPF